MEEGRFVLAGMSDSIKVWEIEQGQMVDIVMKPQSQIYDLKASHDFIFGRFVLSDLS